MHSQTKKQGAHSTSAVYSLLIRGGTWLHLDEVLAGAETKHLLGDGLADHLAQAVDDGVTHVVAVVHQRDAACRTRQRKGANKLALLGAQRLRRQLRHERHAIALLDEVHERLQAPTAITEALIGGILQVAELHELVAEAVPFVQEPKLVATDFGRADRRLLKELGATRHIAKEFLEEELTIDKQLIFRCRGDQRNIDLPREQAGDALAGLELRDRDLQIGEMLAQQRQDKWQEIGCDSRQDAEAKRPRECLLLLADDLLDLRDLQEDNRGLIEDATSDCRRDDGLVATVKDLNPEFILELLDHRAERRLGNLTKVGGPPKVAELIQSLDILELLYIHGWRLSKINASVCVGSMQEEPRLQAMHTRPDDIDEGALTGSLEIG